MKQATRYFSTVALAIFLIICGLTLSACGSGGQKDPSSDEASSSAAVEISGEIINTPFCSVLLPDGWTNDKNASQLRKGDREKLEFVDIWMSTDDASENYLLDHIAHELSSRNPIRRAGSYGEDITIAGIAFKTIEFEERPQYGLYGLKDGKLLAIELSNISLDDPALEVIIGSISPRERTSEKDSSNTAPETKADPSTYIEEGLPLTLTINGHTYTITDIYWGPIVANAKASHGLVVEGTGFVVDDVYPLRCEIIRNGTTSTPEIMVNSSGQTAFTFAFANDNNKPDMVVIWPVDDPDNRYTFALK